MELNIGVTKVMEVKVGVTKVIEVTTGVAEQKQTKGLNTRVFRWLTWLLWATTICLGELTWYGGKTTNLSFLTPGILQAARILWYWSMHSGWPPSMSTANVWLQAWEINDRINITLQESLDCNSVRPSFSIFCQLRDPTPSPQGTMPVSWCQTYKYSKYHSMTWVLPITGALGWKNVGLFIIRFGHWSLILTVYTRTTMELFRFRGPQVDLTEPPPPTFSAIH